MAKRKRLIPPPQITGDGAPMVEPLAEGLPLAALRPGLGQGLTQDAPPFPAEQELKPAPRVQAPPPIARVAADASVQAALDEVAGAMASARAEGRMVLSLPLAAIELNHLVRDRLALDLEELETLKSSIREHGQRMPIEVSDLGQGQYGLISGWRRMQALLQLSAEEPRFGTVLALLRRPADASAAYIAMVEENEVRHGLSYYERARIAARAVEMGVFDSEKQALQRLFSAASRARRSKIGSFLDVYRALDAALKFPALIGERLGLALAKAIEARSQDLPQLRQDLERCDEAGAEQAVLAQFVAGQSGTASRQTAKPVRQEMSPGVFLEVSGGFTKPVLTLSGPAVDPTFRDRLEHWLKTGR